MPSKKRKYNARFPAGRIKKIMQTDEEVGKVAQAVPVIISRTLELFVESLLTKAMEVTNAKNAKTLSPSHMKQCILSESRFDFLKDLVKNIPDINSEESLENSVSSPAILTSTQTVGNSLSDLNKAGTSTIKQPITCTSIAHQHLQTSKVIQQETSRIVKMDDSSMNPPVEITMPNIANVQIQAAVNTNYSANFYTEQLSSSPKPSVIQYNRSNSTSTQSNENSSNSINNKKSNLVDTPSPLFTIASTKTTETTNLNDVPPLIPLMKQTNDNNLYNYCPPSDNLCIDEDYDN